MRTRASSRATARGRLRLLGPRRARTWRRSTRCHALRHAESPAAPPSSRTSQRRVSPSPNATRYGAERSPARPRAPRHRAVGGRGGCDPFQVVRSAIVSEGYGRHARSSRHSGRATTAGRQSCRSDRTRAGDGSSSRGSTCSRSTRCSTSRPEPQPSQSSSRVRRTATSSASTRAPRCSRSGSGGSARRRDEQGAAGRETHASLPFDAGTFDGLTFTYLLRYVEDPATTLRELARVVRPEA